MDPSINEIAQFQLLRPWWLLGLLPVFWLLWKAWLVKRQQGAWQQVIAPQFRALLLGENSADERSPFNGLSVLALGVIWCVAIAALSGPSFKSVQLPAEKNQQGTVILLDLSLSMLADDLSPNRLSRVKYKITDLVQRHPELAIGLVGYAGTAHSITPISEDNQTLLGLLPALNPLIMPLYGSEPLPGFEQAKNLLEGAFVTQGHIIWFTDDLESAQLPIIRNWIESHDYTVSIVPVGTAAGGVVQIPNYGLLKDENGKIILPSLPTARFASLESLTGVRVTPLQINNDSVDFLRPPPSVSRVNKSQDKNQDNSTAAEGEIPTKGTEGLAKTNIVHALDQGAFLLLWLLPLVALLFRRGWILSLSFTLLLPLSFLGAVGLGTLAPTSSMAATDLPNFTDVFQSPDQQAYQAWSNDNYQAAEALFEAPQWRASTLYRLGRYNEAADLFALDDSANGFYNQANALAKSGQLQEAKKAYETALDKQPGFTQASQNLALIEQLLQQQKQTESDDSSDSSSNQTANQEQNSDQQSSQSTQPQGSSSSDQTGDTANNQQAGQDNQSDAEKRPDLSDTSDIAQAKRTNESNKKREESADEVDASDLANSADSTNTTDTENTAESAQASNPNGSQATPPETDGASSGTADTDSDITDEQALPGLADSTLTEQAEQTDPKGFASAETEQKDKTDNRHENDDTPSEEQQATRNWLKQIPDEPGLFLKRKFEYQYQQQTTRPTRKPSNEPSKKQW